MLGKGNLQRVDSVHVVGDTTLCSGHWHREWVRGCPCGAQAPSMIWGESREVTVFQPVWTCRLFGSEATSMASVGIGNRRKQRSGSGGDWPDDSGWGKGGLWPWGAGRPRPG